MSRLELAKHVAKELGCTERVTEAFVLRLFDQAELFDSKQRDYGPMNIATFGEMGVVVRTNDKLARLVNLLFPGGQWNPNTPANESIEDTYRDLSNYGIIALMCRAGEWPTTSEPVPSRDGKDPGSLLPTGHPDAAT